jgi:polar amino acid transport system permease protein
MSGASSAMDANAAAAPYVDPDRAALLRARRRRDITIGTVSTVLFFVIVAYLVTQAPGWPKVEETFFDPTRAQESLRPLLDAFVLNITIFLVAEPFILVLGLGIALMRGLKSPLLAPLRVTAALYTDIVRGIPTILLILLFGFGIPALGINGLTSSTIVWGTVALIVSYSAYVAEVFRSGIDSVHPSQRAAARSLGLSQAQTLRYVVLPQAVRRVVPPLLNDFISLQKDTALVSVLGPLEMVRVAQIDTSFNFNYTAYVVAAAIFVALTVPMARLADAITARMNRRQSAGGGV